MDEWGPASYGDAFADVYDRWYREITDVAACVARLAEVVASATPPGTPNGTVLELGVGTGRLALPLSRRGLDVTGVDASVAMLDRLRAKPGAERLRLVEGDMADLDATELGPPDPGPGFALAFVAFNTLFNLPDHESQRRCLAGLVARLAPGGRVVLETFVPDTRPDSEAEADPDPTGPTVTVSRFSPAEVVLSSATHHPRTQTIVGRHIHVTEHTAVLRPWRVCYLAPDQLVALAGQVGLVALAHWSDWQRRPFDEHSRTLISVYEARP
jgi:SAM-dependent methyltransferase